MRTRRCALWCVAVGLCSLSLAGCSESKPASGLPTLNLFAPTDVANGGLVPASLPAGFKQVICGGTVKVGVSNICWIVLDDEFWGLTVWGDFTALGPPYREWQMGPCGVCGRTYEADYTVRTAGEYQFRFWFRDRDGRLRTTNVTVNAIP
jgi:hypothetical protein